MSATDFETTPDADVAAGQDRLGTALGDAFEAASRMDKATAETALFVAESTLGLGPHPLRIDVRAAACAIDISNWLLACARIESALANRPTGRAR